MKDTGDEHHHEHPVSSAEDPTIKSPRRNNHHAVHTNDGNCEAGSRKVHAVHLSGKSSSQNRLAGHDQREQAVDTNALPTPTKGNVAGLHAQDETQVSPCAPSKSNTLDSDGFNNGSLDNNLSSQNPSASVQSANIQSPINPQPPGPLAEAEVVQNIGSDSDIVNDDGDSGIGLNDGDSALGDDDGSSTTSMDSSINTCLEENGRTYQTFDARTCVFPNDKKEQDRLDLQHHLFTLTFVLDIGTGTGIWAIDFADKHPSSDVLGIDISPIQSEFVPPNLRFEVDDLEQEWTFSLSFNFVYIRGLAGEIKDWLCIFEQSFESLVPGGYIEVVDLCWPVQCDDESMAGDSWLRKWSELIVDSSRVNGSPLDRLELRKSQLEDAGFENVVETLYKWPQNTWPAHPKSKELGRWNYLNMTDGLVALSMALLTRCLGWKREEVDVLLANVRKEIKDEKIHAYFRVYVVYGRKPL